MVYDLIKHRIGNEKFYLIGCTIGDEDSIAHETAHGMWYLDQQYQRAQMGNIAWLTKKHKEFFESLRSTLISDGYTQKVISDEIQAYLSTGIDDSIEADFKKTETPKKTILARFVKTFRKFKND